MVFVGKSLPAKGVISYFAYAAEHNYELPARKLLAMLAGLSSVLREMSRTQQTRYPFPHALQRLERDPLDGLLWRVCRRSDGCRDSLVDDFESLSRRHRALAHESLEQ